MRNPTGSAWLLHAQTAPDRIEIPRDGSRFNRYIVVVVSAFLLMAVAVVAAQTKNIQHVHRVISLLKVK